MKSSISTLLADGWEFTQLTSGPLEPVIPKDQWLATSQFPTEVHVELLKLGKIPDPFVGTRSVNRGLSEMIDLCFITPEGNNEWEVQWISEVDWAFRKSFNVSAADLDAHADLIFDGLDTFAVVELVSVTQI